MYTNNQNSSKDISGVINYDPETNMSYYCRTYCNYTQELEAILRKRYNADCVVVSSGLFAIVTAFESIISIYPKNSKINIILCDEIYCDTRSVCHDMIDRYGIELYFVNITKTDEILQLFTKLKDQNNIFFIESCTNPTGMILDFSIISTLRKMSATMYVIVDNTWLTDVIFDPFMFNVENEIVVDVVVLSLTKYYSAAISICGALITNNPHIIDKAFVWIEYCGAHVSPYNSKVLVDQISTIESRLNSSYSNVVKTLEYLQSKPSVVKIMYPLMPDHQSYDLAKKYFNDGLGPAVISILVKIDHKETKKIINSLTKLKVETSYGRHNHTTVCPHYRKIFIDMEKYVRFRLAIGYGQTFEYVKECLDEFFQKIEQVA